MTGTGFQNDWHRQRIQAFKNEEVSKTEKSQQGILRDPAHVLALVLLTALAPPRRSAEPAQSYEDDGDWLSKRLAQAEDSSFSRMKWFQ